LGSGGKSLSQSITGSGDLSDSHFVQNKKGARAEIFIDVRGADDYTYGYTLSPGDGYGWPTTYVSAGEDLTVHNAWYIDANAQASNSKGYVAHSGISSSSYGTDGGISVEGYSNNAMASDAGVSASQKFDSLDVSKPDRFIWMDETSSNINNKVENTFQNNWLPFTMNGYSSLAKASKDGANVAVNWAQVTGRELGGETKATYFNLLPKYVSEVSFEVPYVEEAPEQLTTISGSFMASSNGKKTTAESALKVADSPFNPVHYSASVTAIAQGYPGEQTIYGIYREINTPGKYEGIAKFDGKKLNVNFVPA
jgi:hypothetical protein